MRVPPYLQDTARTLGLHDWVHRRDFALDVYCATVDDARALVRRHQPSDEAFDPDYEQLVPVIAQVLHVEGALLDHTLRNGHAIPDDQEWLKICKAAAWEVLKRYAEAIDKGEWKP